MRSLALLALVAACLPARAADLHAILATPRHRIETADFRITGRLVQVAPSGNRTSDSLSIRAHWFPGVLRVLVEITAPPAAREHILLEMRPDGRNSILIAHPGDAEPRPLPLDQWSDGPLGPVFSYEDFIDPQYFWPDQSFVETTTFGARTCNVLKSSPGPQDRTRYSQVESWLDTKIGFPVQVHKSVKGSAREKVFTYLGLRQEAGVWSASQIEARVVGRPGSTLLLIERGSPRAHLTLQDFRPELLTRF